MKNLYLIPTDKPSCLSIIDGQLIFSHKYFVNPQHLYITSDSNIEEGFSGWFIGQGGFEKKSIGTDIINGEIYLLDYLGNTDKVIWCKKIILTTDQDLINDGVQAIDDTFLEWFVKNPTCESIKVKLIKDSEDHPEIVGDYREEWEYYDIIIPKPEELKQTYYNTVGKENGEFVIKGQFDTQKEALDLANELNIKFPDFYYDWNKTSNKETIKSKYSNAMNQEIILDKRKAERSYSEEEMKSFGKFCIENNMCKKENRYYQYWELLKMWLEHKKQT